MHKTLALFALLALLALPLTADTAPSNAPLEAEALPDAAEIETGTAEEDVALEDFLSTLEGDQAQPTVPPFCDTVHGTTCSSPGSTKLCSVTFTIRGTCTCSSNYQWMCDPG